MSIENGFAAGRTDEEGRRARVIERLEKKSGFRTHLMVYVAVNTFLVGVWAYSDTPLFWPIFPMVGWGIGVAADGWDAFRPDAASREAHPAGDGPDVALREDTRPVPVGGADGPVHRGRTAAAT